jgi:hypothetical protein
VLLVFLVLWAVMAAAARVDHLAKRGEGQVRWAVGGALLGLGAAAGVRLGAGQLARDPHALRLLAEVLSFGACLLAVLSATWAMRAGERRWARLAAPSGAAAITLLAVCAAALALTSLRAPGAVGTRQQLERQDALVDVLISDE